MDWLVKLIYFTLLVYGSSAQSWEDPFVTEPPNEHVTITGSGAVFNIRMDEEQENLEVAILLYKGPDTDIDLKSQNNEHAQLGLMANCDGITNCVLVATTKMDFEQGAFNVRLTVTIKTVSKDLVITLINIDDNPTRMQLDNDGGCGVEEDYSGETSCKYKLDDEDGFLAAPTFKVPDEYKDLFEFKLDDTNFPTIEKSTTATLNFLKEVKYDTKSLYIFSLLISDDTPSSNTFRVLIEIIDIPNKPPIWTNIRSMYQFDENQEQEIHIQAEDGDIMIQAPISYKITTLDSPWNEFIEIKNETIGLIKVSEINRDQAYFDENTGISLKVVAFEDDTYATEPYEITFIINDVDDEIPEITLTGSPFRICESKNTPIPNLKLSVNDRDVGENARYSVELDKENAFSKAFRLVPESGYQKLDFLLTIDNAELLDYENEKAREISIKITSKGVIGDNFDTEDIVFQLINWNDELPEFDKTSYSEPVDENIPANHLITTVTATDRDGFVILYSLPEGMRTVLEISDTGEIKTRVDNAFDYERQQTLLLYVTATDHFEGDEEGCNPLGTSNPPNTVTVTVTINVQDINDETPILTAIISEDILIMENQDNDTPIDLKSNLIEATDADKDSILLFDIDWTNSRATKYGSRLNEADFKEHVEGFLSIGTEIISGKAVASFKTVDKYEEKPGQSPDYEKFDTVVLRLKVIDTDQNPPNNFATADITILIGDENDNTPIFDDASLKLGNVIENAMNGVLLGRIIARDEDGIGNNEVVYTLEEKDSTQKGVVKINRDNGDLYVLNENSPDTDINCDPNIESLTYVVTATDPKGLFATDDIVIEIQDVNDMEPILEPLTVDPIKEKLPLGTIVATAVAHDGDRDAPNNVIKYTINNEEVSTHFNIDGNSGTITINNPINGDKLTSNLISVDIRATDNNGFGFFDQITISIEILDTNDNSPVIETTTLTANENNGPGDNEYIGAITIVDDDKAGTLNSQVTLKIQKVEYKGDEIFDYFNVSEPIQAVNGKVSTSRLTAFKSLEGFPGTINIELKATDKGVEGEGSVPSTSTVNVEVDLFNFVSPTFEFPNVPGQRFLLNWGTETAVVENFNGDPFDSIKAVDTQGKYTVELKLMDPATGLDHDIVIFRTGSSTTSSPGILIFKSTPDKEGVYDIRFEAINKEGSPSITATGIDVTFIFKDPDAQPEFDITEVINLSIWENDPDAVFNNLPKASYGEGTEVGVVYYHIENPSSTMPFILTTKTGNNLAVNVEEYPAGLDRDKPGGENYLIRIIASRNSVAPTTPDEKSILNVKINVDDRNDNDPVFQGTPYYAALLNTLPIGGRVTIVEATDDDATDILSYAITDYSGYEGVENIENPFKIELLISTAEITLNFNVLASMSGYFHLELTVEDSLEGISTPIKTNALIYIVSDLHRMDFKFLNTIEQIGALMPEILAILKKIFEYECVLERIKEEEETREILAVASVYFIDISENQPILKDTIIEKASVVSVFSQLNNEFKNIGLTLKSFVDNLIFPEDLSEYYKTWLIGVVVVMGVLIGFMIIAFSFKYLGMKKQITRLTDKKFGSMDSGLNRIVAPNTNIYTHDGANPVYCYEQKQEMPDRNSVSSGGSVLYSVEKNPIFANNVEKETSPTPSEI